jgi:hypothetical protein
LASYGWHYHTLQQKTETTPTQQSFLGNLREKGWAVMEKKKRVKFENFYYFL